MTDIDILSNIIKYYKMVSCVQSDILFKVLETGGPCYIPRYRQCYIGKLDIYQYKEDYDETQIVDHFIVCIGRFGWGNRDWYEDDINEFIKNSLYITDYDDDWDRTYGCAIFEIPEKYKYLIQIDNLMEEKERAPTMEELNEIAKNVTEKDEIWNDVVKFVKKENNIVSDNEEDNIVPDKGDHNIVPDKGEHNIIPDKEEHNIVPDKGGYKIVWYLGGMYILYLCILHLCKII